ncbi:MAG: hypothetical protein E7I13_03105 [Negativicoccus succinicivorans]|nr:hypothetical protein [Negativicoccus succinicivorans]
MQVLVRADGAIRQSVFRTRSPHYSRRGGFCFLNGHAREHGAYVEHSIARRLQKKRNVHNFLPCEKLFCREWCEFFVFTQ